MTTKSQDSSVSYSNLERVTFTGADDSVNAQDILSVAKDYPSTEWGILFGGSVGGGNRFPSLRWLVSSLPELKSLNLCAHLCGRFIVDLVHNGRFSWQTLFHQKVGDIYLDEVFKRVQINFHGFKVNPVDQFYTELVKEPYQFIFQDDVVNRDVWKRAVDSGVNAVRLFDVSHGAGVLPEDGWPKRTSSEYMGYAGGLGPNNIKSQLAAIDKAAGPCGPYWIDMESRVRSDFDSKFDMGYVRSVCEQVWGVKP